MRAKTPGYFSKQVRSARRFHFAVRPGRVNQIESGGREECPSNYQVVRERFPHYVIEFVSRGSADIQLGSARWTLPPGSLYVYNSTVPHRLASASREGMTKYFLILKGPNIRGWFGGHSIRAGHVLQVRDRGRIAEIFEDIIEAGCSARRDRQAECLAMTRYLLFKVAESTVSQTPIASGAYRSFLRCKEYIAANYLKLTSAAQIAQACHLDAAYLARLFKRFSEVSPYESLLTLKMEYAARQLTNSPVAAKALAEELGFADPAAFSRSFKRIMGVSPQKMRES